MKRLLALAAVLACAGPAQHSVWINAPWPIAQITAERQDGFVLELPPSQRVIWPFDRGFRGRLWLVSSAGDSLASPWFDVRSSTCWVWAPADWPRPCDW
ncbi:MAG TPA: hypothetical protein VNL18_15540 [Gemmatimonadales bacterium]|nr:hypothetical protein [Gemmatimonadales bacterium]